jgi:hypothetical protein
VEALFHPLGKARTVNQLHFAAPLRRLAVRDEPNIRENAGVVEKLIRERDDCV